MADLRVSKAVGRHGYYALRVSVIDGPELPHFSYNAPFRFRWTEHAVRSHLFANLSNSGQYTFDLGVEKASVTLPKEGAGTKGIIFGDPCTEDGFVKCIKTGNMTARIPRLVNAASNGTDFRVLLGDNFYDRDGAKTGRFFGQLKREARRKVQITMPGVSERERPESIAAFLGEPAPFCTCTPFSYHPLPRPLSLSTLPPSSRTEPRLLVRWFADSRFPGGPVRAELSLDLTTFGSTRCPSPCPACSLAHPDVDGSRLVSAGKRLHAMVRAGHAGIVKRQHRAV
jgi:hypothetical protein